MTLAGGSWDAITDLRSERQFGLAISRTAAAVAAPLSISSNSRMLDSARVVKRVIHSTRLCRRSLAAPLEVHQSTKSNRALLCGLNHYYAVNSNKTYYFAFDPFSAIPLHSQCIKGESAVSRLLATIRRGSSFFEHSNSLFDFNCSCFKANLKWSIAEGYCCKLS